MFLCLLPPASMASSRFLDAARATVMALSSPGSEWANGLALASPQLQGPPPRDAVVPVYTRSDRLRESSASQSTDRSYRSLISSALDVINELRERGFASETLQTSRSSGVGGASDASWRDDNLQASAVGTPFSSDSSRRRPPPRTEDPGMLLPEMRAGERSVELPSSSTQIHAYATATSRGIPETSAVPALTGLRASPQPPVAAESRPGLRANSAAEPLARSAARSAMSPPAADGQPSASAPLASSSQRWGAGHASTGGRAGADPGGQRLVPLGSPPFAYSPFDDVERSSGSSGSSGRSTRGGRASDSRPSPRVASPMPPALRPEALGAAGPTDSHLVPSPLRSPSPVVAAPPLPAPLRPDPETALIEEAVNEWLNDVAPQEGAAALGQTRALGAAPRGVPDWTRSSPRPPSSEGSSPTPPPHMGAHMGADSPRSAPRTHHSPSDGDNAHASSSRALRQSEALPRGSAAVVAGDARPHVGSRLPPPSSGEVWRLQRAVEATYHALVRARRARSGPSSLGIDPRFLPLSAPGATEGGRFAETWQPPQRLQREGPLTRPPDGSPRRSEDTLAALCAELGVDPADPGAHARLLGSMQKLSRVAVSADTLDRFAERVCALLGGRLLGPAAATHVGLEQAVILLDAMVSELEGLRRLRRAGGSSARG